MTDTKTHLGVQQLWKSLRDPKTVSHSPRNRSELAKTVNVDSGHVNVPRGSSVVEIALGPKTLSNSARNGPESTKIVIVNNPHVIAPRGWSIVEIILGPLN